MRQPVDPHAPPIVQAFDTAFRYLRWLAVLMALLYLFSGITSVQPGEKAIVLTFGRVSRVKTSGLLLAWPFPIDEVERVATGESKRLEVKDLWKALPGLQSGEQSVDPLSPNYVFPDEYIPEQIDPQREGYCITGDEDVLQAYVAVKYQVEDPVQYALGNTEPEAVLRSVVLAATTHAMAGVGVDYALANRAVLAERIRSFVRDRLEQAQTGISVENVELIHLHPPRHVIKEFQDVVKANIERQTRVGQAKADKQTREAQARVQRTSMITDAETEAQHMLQEARGEAEAFTDLVAEYKRAPTVVAARLYRETLEKVFKNVDLRTINAVPGGETIVVIDEDPFADAEEATP